MDYWHAIGLQGTSARHSGFRFRRPRLKNKRAKRRLFNDGAVCLGYDDICGGMQASPFNFPFLVLR
jgi:hypothetical protein